MLVCFHKSDGTPVSFEASKTKSPCTKETFHTKRIRNDSEELKLLSLVRGKSPNIVQLARVSRSGNAHVVVTTIDAGTSLDNYPIHRARRTFWHPEKRKEIFRKDIRAAFRILHDLGYTYTDLHPRNVAYDGNKFTLLDLGGAVRNHPVNNAWVDQAVTQIEQRIK